MFSLDTVNNLIFIYKITTCIAKFFFSFYLLLNKLENIFSIFTSALPLQYLNKKSSQRRRQVALMMFYKTCHYFELLRSPYHSFVLCRVTCVVRRQQFYLNNIFSKTPWPILIKHSRKVPCIKLYQSCFSRTLVATATLG